MYVCIQVANYSEVSVLKCVYVYVCIRSAMYVCAYVYV